LTPLWPQSSNIDYKAASSRRTPKRRKDLKNATKEFAERARGSVYVRLHDPGADAKAVVKICV
jgi:hypothetical protein